jgi:hypothetical protein
MDNSEGQYEEAPASTSIVTEDQPAPVDGRGPPKKVLQLVKSMPVRWNSTFGLIERLVVLRKVVD